LIRNYELDLTQREREECVAASQQSRSYEGRLDEFAYSRDGRAVLSVGGRFCHNKFCDVLMAALNTRLEFMTEKRESLMSALST
jgi:hypothetical protein